MHRNSVGILLSTLIVGLWVLAMVVNLRQEAGLLSTLGFVLTRHCEGFPDAIRKMNKPDITWIASSLRFYQ